MSEQSPSEKNLFELLLNEEINQEYLNFSLKKLRSLLGINKTFLFLQCKQSTFEVKIGEVPPGIESYFTSNKIVSIKDTLDSTLTLIPLNTNNFNAILGMQCKTDCEPSITNLLPVIKNVFKKLCIDFLNRNATFCSNNRMFEQLIKATNDLLIIHHMDGTIKYVNQALLKLSGYRKDEVIGKNITLFLPQNELQQLNLPYKERISGKSKKFLFESKFINAKGESIPVEATTFTMEESKDFEHIVVIARNISKKKLAEQKIIHLNRILSVIRNVNQLIVREKDEDKFLSRSCQLIAEAGDFNFTWIVRVDENFNIEFVFSYREKPASVERSRLKKWLKDQGKNNEKLTFLELKKDIAGSKKIVLLPVKKGQTIYGELIVGLSEGSELSREERKLFIEMVNDLGYAIHMRRLERQSELIKHSIEVINKKLKGKTAQDILSSLVNNLSKVLNTEYVFIGKLAPNSKDKIETLLFLNENCFQKNLIYKLEGTPSQQLLEQGTLAVKKGICKLFKKDKLLRQFGAEGYLGTPVYSSSGQKIGVFATFSKNPISNVDFLKSIIEFFAHRIGLEMERMEAEEKLRRSEEKFRNIFKYSPFGIYQTSLDGRVLEANPALVKMLGYENLNELLQRDIEKDGYQTPEDRQKFLDKVLKANGFIVHEDVWLKKDRTPVYIREKARVVRDEKGKVLYIEGTVEDISERKAREEEILYQSQLLAAAQDPIIATDLQNRITYWNKSAEKFYGYTEEEVKGRLIDDVVKMALTFEERLKIREIVKKKGYWRGEIEQFKRNGEKVHVDMAISLLYNSEGIPEAIVGINRDISDKVRYREALKASDESYRGLYNAVEEAIYVQNPDGSFLDVNEGAVKMYGYPRTFFLGKNPADLSPPGKNDMNMVREKFQKALNGEPQVFEFWGKRANGEIFPKIVRLYKGKYFGKQVVIALAIDISEQKRSEENLRKLTAAVEQSPNSILITDPEGRIEYVNQKFCEVTQYKVDEVLGKSPEILKSNQTEPDVYNGIWQSIKSGKVWHGELLQKRKDGTPLWEDVLVSPIFNDSGQVTQILWLKQDITDRKKLEEEKQRLEKQLHQNQRLETIGTLAGGIAHDFNNILTPILGYAEMIKMRYKKDHQLKNQVEQIIKASLRARDLIQQILTFSRQVDHEQKPVYLQTIVNEAYHLIRASIPSTISVVRKIDKKCKPVLGDPAKLHQVLMNLCTNAYQAMEKKGGTLRIELKMKTPDVQMLKEYPQLRKADYVCLTVADTGEGMDAQTMERIFEPFFTTKGVGKGTGLGLSVVHGIVKNYDGEIIVKSEKGKGSDFSVYLPVAEVEEKETSSLKKEVVGGKEKILLVDDEPAVLQLQQKVLEHFGYQVMAFNHPLEALKYFKANGDDIHLLITDLTMPEMTGVELAKKINALNSNLPIILATGYSEELTPTQKKQFGIREILMKPVIAAHLAATVRKVLDESKNL